ncbi:MAG: ATP-binding protein [Polyangiaceae bacterium]
MPSSAPPESGLRTEAARAALQHRWVTRHLAIRIGVLALTLGAITLFYLGDRSLGGFTALVAYATVSFGFGISAIGAAILRKRRVVREVGFAQIVVDQALWTALIYITGGVTSGCVSLYGLTCVIASIVFERRGAIVAYVVAVLFYAALALSFAEGWIAAPRDQANAYAAAWGAIAYPLFANLFALGIVAGLAGYLSERLRQSSFDVARATERADRAEQLALLGKLAAGLAHEIRNPLGSIAGSVELLKTGANLTEEDRALCDIVQREVLRLNDLVGDMLDLSRSRAPQIAQVSLPEILNDVVTLARQQGRGRDVPITYEGPSELIVSADAAQIRQVAWNLVRNAVSVSPPEAGVLVKLSPRPNVGYELSVRDEGPGIPEEARERLFDAFFTTRSQGTGVGLAVVKRILDEHAWSIETTSDSSGTTFTVVIPMKRLLSQPPPPRDSAVEHGSNVEIPELAK